MNKNKQSFFLPRVKQNNQTYEYLGSDGQPLESRYNAYKDKCAEFKMKAIRYKKENINLKTSLVHHTVIGFENSDKIEEDIINERNEHLEFYKKIYNVTNFNQPSECMYENSDGLNKRIRIIRELNEPLPSQTFSDNFDKKTHLWFTRYCSLARFIQAARMIIILNRLKKNLNILRHLKPGDIAKYEL
ncbi:hypothetical protein Phum_PHUM278180 [Pediculus humanus corporis]|uniref:Uncharacterized protein n=1 Tax=Pediculus humanus subsp. corporis TaxID=121224 RepID=E0VL12_PEDHC|nr:uncharacterized protein Phum_PHUM278180 [Pediculus humanus corporis]EEB14068.1 hypothetical protein Phum_PHUM278180 [Pediculus humanus corporis]